jgi:hypothetical protein
MGCFSADIETFRVFSLTLIANLILKTYIVIIRYEVCFSMKEKLCTLLEQYDIQYALIFDFTDNSQTTLGELEKVAKNGLIATWLGDIDIARNLYENYREGTRVLPAITSQANVNLILHIPKEGILTGFLTDKWTFKQVLEGRTKKLGDELEEVFSE